jgi:hypothetical protein
MGMALYRCVELQDLAVDTAAWALKPSEERACVQTSRGFLKVLRQKLVKGVGVGCVGWSSSFSSLHVTFRYLGCVRWSLLVEAGTS